MIDRFAGKYRFLSNFSTSVIYHEGLNFMTVEHAYQAAKTSNYWERKRIQNAITPTKAKRLGRVATLRPRWEQLKCGIMFQLVEQKFRNPKLRKKLLATGGQLLVEGNTWHDNYWGICKCRSCRIAALHGYNMLGITLMRIREEIKRRKYVK